jgi:hypothetical protein
MSFAKMTIVGTYKPSNSANRVENFLLRYQKNGRQVVEWVQDDSAATPIPGQPKYKEQLEAIDWFYDHFQAFDPEVHVE